MERNNFSKISIVIPVYNEEKTLREILRRVAVTPVLGLEKEIIVVDDGSTDRTKEILKDFKGKCKIIYQEKNQGKGAALKVGFGKASGDIILVQDADLEYDPREIEEVIRPIVENKAEAVFSSRFMGQKPHRVLYFWHYLGNKFLTVLSNIFTDLNLTDMESGYKAFDRKTIDQISPNLFNLLS